MARFNKSEKDWPEEVQIIQTHIVSLLRYLTLTGHAHRKRNPFSLQRSYRTEKDKHNNNFLNLAIVRYRSQEQW